MAGDDSTSLDWEAGSVVYITTGAPVPTAADAVVKVEDTRVLKRDREGNERMVRLLTTAKPGDYIRRIGSDIAENETVLRARTRLTASSIGLLAMVRLILVLVHKTA